MSDFQPPHFRPHRWLRGGHLQTLVSVRGGHLPMLTPVRHKVSVSDGDAVVLHQDQSPQWKAGDPSLLLIHGLAGCHSSPYMVRLTDQFVQRGWNVFRIDMRGCGAAHDLAAQLTHAGRSDDIVKALQHIARTTREGPINAAGISLGGSQLLRAVGRIGGGIDPRPPWFDRLRRVAAVAPPLDLRRCSENMQRWKLRPYNFYFIRSLLAHVPPRVRAREDFQRQLSKGRPRTLRELDDRFTGPLSGFHGAEDYYATCAAKDVVRFNPIETLVMAAQDDPLVPIWCFHDPQLELPEASRVLVSPTGGHVGFIDRTGGSWMDQVLLAWFSEGRETGL